MRHLIPLLLACAALAADRTPEVLPLPAGASLAGLTLVDQRGGEHVLASEARSRLVMLFPIDQRFEAKRCDQSLTRRLDAAAPLIRVIDAAEIAVEDRPTLVRRVGEAVGEGPELFLFDWEGAVRRRLGLAEARLVLVGTAADGAPTGMLAVRAEAATIQAGLALIGRPVEPPFTPEEFARVKKGR